MGTTYSPPVLTPAKAKAHENGEFDFLMPFAKNLLRTDEVAEVINRDQAYVRALVEAGRLEAHRDSALGTRKSNLITRRSVILYLAETSDYDPSFLVMRVIAIFKTFKRPALDRVIAAAQKQREQVQ